VAAGRVVEVGRLQVEQQGLIGLAVGRAARVGRVAVGRVVEVGLFGWQYGASVKSLAV